MYLHNYIYIHIVIYIYIYSYILYIYILLSVRRYLSCSLLPVATRLRRYAMLAGHSMAHLLAACGWPVFVCVFFFFVACFAGCWLASLISFCLFTFCGWLLWFGLSCLDLLGLVPCWLDHTLRQSPCLLACCFALFVELSWLAFQRLWYGQPQTRDEQKYETNTNRYNQEHAEDFIFGAQIGVLSPNM